MNQDNDSSLRQVSMIDSKGHIATHIGMKSIKEDNLPERSYRFINSGKH